MPAHQPNLRIKRIHEADEGGDGYRVLVDRVWPRGISKQRARLDAWRPDVAPSTQLRAWFGHEPPKFDEFTRRYRDELDASAQATEFGDGLREHPVVTLLYGAKDTAHNQAVVLRDWLTERASQAPRSSGPSSPRS